MIRPLVLAAVLLPLLSACKPSTPAAPETTAQPADTTAAAEPVPADNAAPPSFDCNKASGEFEQLVCKEPELAALDRQLADSFAQALAKSADKARLQAEQRGWIKGRDGCWKAGDKTACVRDAYVVRIVDLRLQHGLAATATTVEYRCDDAAGKPFTAAFHNDVPSAVVLTWGDDRAIVPAAVSASGARYAAEGIEFWEHQGEASVNFHGNMFKCTPAGG